MRAALESASSPVPFGGDLAPLLGLDPSVVVTHLGTPEAVAALSAMGAEAASVDDHLLFASRSPDRHLVAHELAHLAQARRGSAPTGSTSKPGDRSEREADEVAEKVVRGQPAAVEAAPTGELSGGWFSNAVAAATQAVSTVGAAVASLAAPVVDSVGPSTAPASAPTTAGWLGNALAAVSGAGPGASGSTAVTTDAAEAILTPEQVQDRLSYGLLDWRISDADAEESVSAMAAMDDATLNRTVELLGEDGLRRLTEHYKGNLPLDLVTRIPSLDPALMGLQGNLPGGVEYEDFSDSGVLFSDGGPTASDVVQSGELGDCWALAPLSSIAGTDPSYIEAMILPDGTGNYKVRLYRPVQTADGLAAEAVWITVDADLPAHDGELAYATSDAESPVLWPALTEKALSRSNLAEAWGEALEWRSDAEGNDADTTGYDDIHFDYTEVADIILLGQMPTTLDTDASGADHDDQWRNLLSALERGDAVTVNKPGHTMSVLRVEERDGETVVIVRNQQEGSSTSGEVAYDQDAFFAMSASVVYSSTAQTD